MYRVHQIPVSALGPEIPRFDYKSIENDLKISLSKIL